MPRDYDDEIISDEVVFNIDEDMIHEILPSIKVKEEVFKQDAIVRLNKDQIIAQITNLVIDKIKNNVVLKNKVTDYADLFFGLPHKAKVELKVLRPVIFSDKLTYFTDEETNFSQDPNQWRWELEGMVMHDVPAWTIDHVDYYGHNMSVSQIIPMNVYNQTAYSVVAETCWQNDFAFFTEKTVKPIIAQRLFVMFAGKGYLANLRRLGFKTFGDVIDESYDDELDDLVRWAKAWIQVKWLSEQPQELILERIRPVVEHNARVMLTTDWYDLFQQQFEQDFVRITAG
jgi:hypothetical protein